MTLHPPIAPMLGRLARELPDGDFLDEPKWHGFRWLACREQLELTPPAAAEVLAE